MGCVQLTFAGKNLGDDALAAKILGDVALAEAVAVKEKPQHLGRRRLRHFEVLRFVALDQEGEQLDGFELSGRGIGPCGKAEKLPGVGGELFLVSYDVGRAALDHSGRIC